MTFKEYMNEANGIMLHTDRSIYTGKQLEEIAEAYHQYKLASDGVSADVRISLPSDALIHSVADEISLRDDTRDRMIYAIGIERGAKWVREKIREQLGSES